MSNLLDLASIVLTPTAYNNGEALCIKPDDASGDFQFSRNSAATRVNAQGFVENVQILSSNLVQNGDFSEEGVEEVSNGSFSQEGSELITNGDFSSDTAWGKEVGWSISDGSLVANSVTTGLAFQSNIVEANKFYKATYDVVVTSGSIGLYFDGGTGYQGIATTTQTVTVFFKATTASPLYFRSDTSNFTGSIDNVSVREVGQDWTLGTGWSIADNKAVATVGSGGLIQSGLSIVSGKTYNVTFDVNINSGTLLYDLGDAPSKSVTQSGSVSVYFVSQSTTAIRFFGSTFEGSITNISVKEVGQNWSVSNSDANNYVEFGDGTARLKFLNVSPITQLMATAPYVSGKKYKLIVDVASVTSGSIKVANAGIDETFDTVGISTRIINPTGTSNIEFYRASADVDITLNSVSLIEITDDTNLPRINYEGFSYQDALGSELVTNGDFSNGTTGWAFAEGWSVVNNQATTLGVSLTPIRQTVLVNGTNRLTFDVVEGGAIVYTNYPIFSIKATFSTVGTHTIDLLSDGVGDNRFLYIYNNGAGNSATIDNVSVKEVLGQEVVPDSGCGSWLWEPQSTNLITQSELFSDATWTKVGGGAADDTIITSNYATSPDGTNNASRAQFNAVGTANGDRANLYANINVTSGQTFTMSFYGKSATATNEEVVLRMGSVQQVSVTLTQEYQRFSHTYTVTSSGAKNFGIQIRGNSAVTSADIIIWGFQVEQQSYATSYIPTSGSTVTRNQDVCTNGGSLASINSTEGVLYAEIAALADDLTLRSISLSDGTTNNVATIRYRTNSNRIQVVVFNGGVLQFSNSFDVTNILDFNKVAISYNQSDFNYWVNGVKRANSTSGNTPIGMNKLSFDNGGSHPFFGKTKALAVWKEALSDAELTELTTI